jgi:hypothetical protein
MLQSSMSTRLLGGRKVSSQMQAKLDGNLGLFPDRCMEVKIRAGALHSSMHYCFTTLQVCLGGRTMEVERLVEDERVRRLQEPGLVNCIKKRNGRGRIGLASFLK